MLHLRTGLTGLVTILAALVLAPAVLAASPSKASAGAGAAEQTYGKHCGPKTKRADRGGTRTKCIAAMAKLARGDSASPKKACRALSRKRIKGERKSAFVRCVAEGKKLLKAKKRADRQNGGSKGDAGADDGSGDDSELDFPDSGNDTTTTTLDDHDPIDNDDSGSLDPADADDPLDVGPDAA
jgi:hypothetical protein